MDIYTIIFLALAVFIFLRLRSVLGQRTGEERPPFERTREGGPAGNDSNVIPMPTPGEHDAPAAPVRDMTSPDRWKGIAESGTRLASGLDALVQQDSSFDPRHFITGARGAYEMIVLAFANGDRRALRDLLSSDVYESFDGAITEREKNGHRVETRFVSIDRAELVDAEVRDRTEQITVRFVSQMITATRDASGTVVDGNAEQVTDITDVWTFAREISSRDPNWKLVGTSA